MPSPMIYIWVGKRDSVLGHLGKQLFKYDPFKQDGSFIWCIESGLTVERQGIAFGRNE